MKQKTINKKLVINKMTITNLTISEQGAIRCGKKDTLEDNTCYCTAPGLTCPKQEVEAAATVQGRTCDGTVQGRTCD